jgi:hypothetical protein
MVGKINVSGCWSEVAAYYHKVGESDLNCVCFPARSRISIQDQRSQKIIFKPLNLQGIAGVCPTISYIQSNLNFVLENQSQWILFLLPSVGECEPTIIQE